jgi:hypothetical protein
MISQFCHFIINKFSIFTEKLALHPEAGIFGMLQVIFLSHINPVESYETSNTHLLVLILKDVGIASGALLTIITLYVYVKKNLLNKNGENTPK